MNEERRLTSDQMPPENLVHIGLYELDRDMLTSPDGKTIQVKLSAVCKLLANPPPMLRPTLKHVAENLEE